MRSHHVVAIVVVLIIGFGAKVLFFSSPAAEAEVPNNASMNILQMHLDHPNIKALPVEDVKDPV
jgi:hypothetical protein